MDNPEPIKKKHAGGRPKKSLDSLSLPSNWKVTVFKLASQGLSKEEIYLHHYRINPYLFDALYEREAEFFEVVKKAELLCKGWWMEIGRKSLKKQYFHDALWYMNMKNRFGWKDRSEVDHGLADSLLEKYKDSNADDLIKAGRELAKAVLGDSGSDSAPADIKPS